MVAGRASENLLNLHGLVIGTRAPQENGVAVAFGEIWMRAQRGAERSAVRSLDGLRVNCQKN
jgi:hypothetical protein